MGSTSGAYHRRIRLTSKRGRVVAALEDDFHRFDVTLEHDGERIARAFTAAGRYPWTTCPDAGTEIAKLAGVPLSRRSTALAEHADPRQHCTHMFDLAGLALAHAAAGRDRREYDVVVPDRVDGRTRATLHRDGELLLAWDLVWQEIVDPPPYAGRSLRGGGFLAWAESTLDEETAEAAIVLRRALTISFGRVGTVDLDAMDTAEDVHTLTGMMDNICYTFREGRRPVALRMRGTTEDFSNRSDDLLA